MVERAGVADAQADGADIVPAWCGVDAQSTAEVDAFFVPPTAYFGDKQNGNWDDGTAELMTELGLIVTAAAFNGAAAVYAPRYRQAGQSAQDAWKNFNWQPPPARGRRHHRRGDAPRLRRRLPPPSPTFPRRASGRSSSRAGCRAPSTSKTLIRKACRWMMPQERLVAAYLIGNTVEEGELPLEVCRWHRRRDGLLRLVEPVVEGGTAGAASGGNKTAAGTGAGTPVCVNPLTWEYGARLAGAAQPQGRGAVPLLGHLFLSHNTPR